MIYHVTTLDAAAVSCKFNPDAVSIYMQVPRYNDWYPETFLSK